MNQVNDDVDRIVSVASRSPSMSARAADVLFQAWQRLKNKNPS